MYSHFTLILSFLLNILSDDKPDFCDLLSRVVYKYAVHWEQLGLELGLERYNIDTISYNNKHNPNRAEDCCAAMLKQWLREIPLPTWGKLRDAIKKITSKTGNYCFYVFVSMLFLY